MTWFRKSIFCEFNVSAVDILQLLFRISFWSRNLCLCRNKAKVVVGRWRQHTACVRLCFSLAFSIFQIKMEPINSHFLAILGRNGTFRNQWQSLINSQIFYISISWKIFYISISWLYSELARIKTGLNSILGKIPVSL